MDSARRSEVDRICRAAAACPAAERAAFLTEACSGDTALRHDVEALLDRADSTGGFVDGRSIGHAAQMGGDPAESLTGRRLGHYQLQALLGVGGMGVVYRAHDDRLDRPVALKLIRGPWSRSSTREQLVHEARAASALNHPHICTIYETSEADGQSYLAMEYVPGRRLDHVIPDGGLAAETLIDYAHQIIDAIAHAHDRGVVHRDLKSANVMVTREGQIKVLDFGVARRIPEATLEHVTQSRDTVAGQAIVGTLSYMAPEVLRGQPADARSDIWAFGVLLYELATRRLPFSGTTGFEISSAILNHAPSPLPATLPTGLGVIIERCLMKDPQRRYERAGEVRAALDAIRPAPTPLRLSPRRPMATIAVAAGLVLFAIAVPFFYWSSPERDRTAPSARVRLAILPFHVLNSSEEIGFLGIGIPDAIITTLASVGQLSLRPTSAILAYEQRQLTPQAAGGELQVDYVVPGTIQTTEDRFRITVQLVRVRDGAPIWGERYDLKRTDLLTLQDAIAERVAEALNIRMVTAERDRLRRRYTENPVAHDLYLQGRSQLVRMTSASTLASLEAFERAIERDPGYPAAYAGLAMASAQMRIRFAKTEADVAHWEEQAKRVARRALELDPSLAEAHEALAAVYGQTDFDWERTIEESRLALALNANLDGPHNELARAFYHLGLFDLTDREVRAAMSINPANRMLPLRNLGLSALFSGRTASAVSLLEEAAGLSAEAVQVYLPLGYYYLGQAARAEEMLRGTTGSQSNQRRAEALFASLLAARGARAEAEKLLHALARSGYMDHHVAYNIGTTHAQLGRPTEAKRWLEQAASSGFPCYPWYVADPLLLPLQDDPEFRKFVAALRVTWESSTARYGS